MRLRVAHSYIGLSERGILYITNNNFKYRKLNAKFYKQSCATGSKNKTILPKLHLDIFSMKSQFVSWKGKTYHYFLSLMESFSLISLANPFIKKPSFSRSTSPGGKFFRAWATR